MASVDNIEIVTILANDVIFTRNWKLFCKGLGISQNVLFELEKKSNSNAPLTDIIIDIMDTWKSTSPENANPKTLSEKLRIIGCNTSAVAVDALFLAAGGSSDSSGTATAKQLISRNLEYLVDNLTNVLKVVTSLVSADVITMSEKATVMSNANATDNDKSNALFSTLEKKDLDANELKLLIDILENSGNRHLAKKLK